MNYIILKVLKIVIHGKEVGVCKKQLIEENVAATCVDGNRIPKKILAYRPKGQRDLGRSRRR